MDVILCYIRDVVDEDTYNVHFRSMLVDALMTLDVKEMQLTRPGPIIHRLQQTRYKQWNLGPVSPISFVF